MNSTIPAVLAALYGTFQGALPGSVQVGRGTPLQTQKDFVLVGYDDGDSPGVTWERGAFSGQVLRRQVSESFDVQNLLSVWVGGGSVSVLAQSVDKAFSYLATLDAALTEAAPPAGVARWYVASGGVQQVITGEGAVATLPFVVHVDSVAN